MQPDERQAGPSACSQCGVAAMYTVNGHPLCVDCCLKTQQIAKIDFERQAAWHNILADEMDYQMGLPLTSPKIKFPQSTNVMHTGPTSFHNITITGGNVGAVVSGYAARIDLAIDRFNDAGNRDLATRLQSFTQAIVDEKALSDKVRAEVVSMLAHLADETRKPAANRNQAVARSLFASVREAVSACAELAKAWGVLHPLLAKLFAAAIA